MWGRIIYLESLGSWNFSFVYLVGLAAVLIHAEFRAQERVTAVKAVQCMRDTRILKKVVDELPSWVFVSDYERVEWLNKAVHKLWPFIKKATAESITSSLHPIFDSARVRQILLFFVLYSLFFVLPLPLPLPLMPNVFTLLIAFL